MNYKLTNKIDGEMRCIIRIDDGACIPLALSNTDYQEYIKWTAEGNEPHPADEPTETTS